MKGNGGFTLIELILVTVIIGILAGMVALNVGGRVQDAQIKAAKGDIATYSTAIDMYALDNNDSYPKTLEDLVNGKRKYVKELRPDPWGNPYVFEVSSGSSGPGEYKIFSAGADGMPNTEDDVTSSSIHE